MEFARFEPLVTILFPPPTFSEMNIFWFYLSPKRQRHFARCWSLEFPWGSCLVHSLANVKRWDTVGEKKARKEKDIYHGCQGCTTTYLLCWIPLLTRKRYIRWTGLRRHSQIKENQSPWNMSVLHKTLLAPEVYDVDRVYRRT